MAAPLVDQAVNFGGNVCHVGILGKGFSHIQQVPLRVSHVILSHFHVKNGAASFGQLYLFSVHFSPQSRKIIQSGVRTAMKVTMQAKMVASAMSWTSVRFGFMFALSLVKKSNHTVRKLYHT